MIYEEIAKELHLHKPRQYGSGTDAANQYSERVGQWLTDCEAVSDALARLYSLFDEERFNKICEEGI